MMDLQNEDHLSSSLASVTTVRKPVSQAGPPYASSHQADPASVPLHCSPSLSPSVTTPSVFATAPVAEADAALGEIDGSGCAFPRPIAKASVIDSPSARMADPVMAIGPSDHDPQISFEDFATRYSQSKRKQAQRKRLESRLRATKVSIGISARMIRVGNSIQRGLVEALKHDDKANFVVLYRMLCELQESCAASASRDRLSEALEDREPPVEPSLDHTSDFFHQLSPQSRADLVDILRLVRSDPQFLVDRLRSLTSSQLAALTAPASTLDSGDPTFLSSSRSRSQYFYNRNPVQFGPFKDHAYAFERTDPLSILLCNVFAAPVEPDTSDASLRVEVWSSVCAQLMSSGSSRFYPLIGRILSFWATGSTWKARPKFELYLMDILQTGAFLLEHIDTIAESDYAAESLDPLRTDAAEEFFASAVEDLFRVLDDLDGGFPHAVLHFAKAVLQKLDHPDIRCRFLEYLFIQWFFPKFLYSALTYPETHGLLMDFHIRKDARDKLLNQVVLRAYSQVFAVLRSMNHFSILRPSIKRHVDNMLSHFRSTPVDPSSSVHSGRRNSSSTFLLLSTADVLTVLDALFPQAHPSVQSSPVSTGIPSWSSLSPGFNLRQEPHVEPGLFRSIHDSSPRPPSQSGSIFSMDSSHCSIPDTTIGQSAARIRFELTELDEPSARPRLEHPLDEHWTILSVTKDGHGLIWSLLPNCEYEKPELSTVDSDDDAHSTIPALAENYEALQTAIVRLVHENHIDEFGGYDRSSNSPQSESTSLKEYFDQAMASCHNASDFVGAHYWWNASKQLRQGRSTDSHAADDSWILVHMHRSCTRSLIRSRTVIERCETSFASLDSSLHWLQNQIQELMATVAKIRNKMWYMTDVKNSLRYEEARHVAMALKTMVYPARPDVDIPEEPRYRTGARSLGGSLFQKPEMQVMNIMKAPSSQGGPKKLSDDQVDLTRKWLSHNAIENFCKGEERIHRFCYEVRASINRLVGETMAETPVLWASELFQIERAKYESYASRPFPGLSMPSTPRPSTTTSEDILHASNLHSVNVSMPDPLSRSSHDVSFLGHKPSIQSLVSDKWRAPRDIPSNDLLSIGGSPGRATSTSTGDTYSTFWSASQKPPMYAASVSSVYSRPPSTFSETLNWQSRRSERKTQGKAMFMDSLKQTLTSLLLSDLGSPVWSCGSETDAWFTNKLDQPRIRKEMQKRAAVQKFYADYDVRARHLRDQRRSSGGRRSRSLGTPALQRTMSTSLDSASVMNGQSLQDDDSGFPYKEVFHRLIQVFSRHGNPFVKLNALRDLRSLVMASLIPFQHFDQFHVGSGDTERIPHRDSCPQKRSIRRSCSEVRATALSQSGPSLPTSSPSESVTCGSRQSVYATPSEDQIVATMRDLILDFKPRTLFRDLQFISAFVPADQLSKTDRGTAFLQFGLAALSLKDEVCHSMVEIADRIVSQELMRRNPIPGSDIYPRSGHAMEDAAEMWIITAKEGNPVAQRELAILYLTHPELLPRVTLPLTRPRDTFKAEMMYRRGKDSKSDPQSMCLALHWMQLSASGGDILARNRLREREEFDSIA